MPAEITGKDAIEIIESAGEMAGLLIRAGDGTKGILVHQRAYALAGERDLRTDGGITVKDGDREYALYLIGITPEEAAKLGVWGFRETSTIFTEHTKDEVLELIGRKEA